MNDISTELSEWLSGPRLWTVVRALSTLVFGFLLARLASAAVVRTMSRLQTPQQMALTRRITSWGLFAIALMMAIRQLGFDITALLGAAGVLTVAIGFASQTTASNMISGLFLSSERGFEVGAVIKVGTTIGEVISIDLLSVKMRTFDNLLVRMPNETLIKSEIATYNHFPIRRVDVPVTVSYGDDLKRVEAVMLRVAEDNPLCLEEPRPLFMVLGFLPDGVSLQFSVWTQRESFLDMRTSLLRELKEAFDAEGLRFALPQRDLHARDRAAPLASPQGAAEKVAS